MASAWNPKKVAVFKRAFFDFLENCYIDSKETGGRYCLAGGVYRAQHRFLDGVFNGLEEDIHDFKVLKSRQLGLCLDPETRVLTADLRWVPIKDLECFDEVISLDEKLVRVSHKKKLQTRRMRTGVVLDNIKIRANAYRISFDDGRSVICTAEHPWLARLGNVQPDWRALKPRAGQNARGVLKPGAQVRWVTKPWGEPDIEDGWFGGMLDGEGSISNENRSGASVNVSQLKGPVWDRIMAYARDRGYHGVVENDETPRKTKYGNSPVPKLCFNRLDEIFRLIGQTRPTRFIGKRFWEDREPPGKNSGVGWATITKVESLGERELIDLQTTTGTYIAEGFVSHNTTIARALSVFWIGMHDGLRAGMVFDKADNTEEARKEITQMINELPAKLKFPKIVGGKGNRYGLALDNNSRITFMSAGVRASRTTGALGASKGLNFLHGSELCSWENDEGVVSLQQALAEEFENRLYIYESTARGFNKWHEIWVDCRNDTLNQRAIFIGWWAKDNQIIRESDPAFKKYGLLPPTPEEQARISEVKERYGWQVTQEQLAWFRRKSDPVSANDDKKNEDPHLQQNQPWTEDEAFVMSGSSFFAADKLKERMEFASRQKFEAFKYYPGSNFMETDVMPARWQRDAQFKVWQEPDKDGEYVVAVDPAFGHDERNDRSAIQVCQVFADGLDQVAEFASASVQTHQLAWIIASIVGWYRNVTLVIEINGPGEAVWREYQSLKQIVQSGYMRKAAEEKGLRDIFNNVRNYVYSRGDSMIPGGSVLHWKTQSNNKVPLMERLQDFVHNGGIIIRSTDTLEEMRAITRDGDKIEAEGRNKDDRPLALAMAIRCWEDRVRKKLIAHNRTREAFSIQKQMSPQNMYYLYTKNQLSTFFKKKENVRRDARSAAVRQSWRGR